MYMTNMGQSKGQSQGAWHGVADDVIWDRKAMKVRYGNALTRNMPVGKVWKKKGGGEDGKNWRKKKKREKTSKIPSWAKG